MKIGIDIREFSVNQKELFLALLKELKIDTSGNIFNVYHNNKTLDFLNTNSNLNIINVDIKSISIKEQTIFLKKLKDDNNDVNIFFNETRPIFLKGKSIQIIKSLENILYPNLIYSRLLKKYSYLYILKSGLKKSYKIITFDQKTKKNINEKLNLNEEKIHHINPFFVKYKDSEINIDIKQKHSLSGDYLIYDDGIGNNKNIQRMLTSIKEINKNDQKVHLFLIGSEINNDTEIRQSVISLGITDYCHFIGEIPKDQIGEYYKQSLGTIYPNLYSSLPLGLSKSLNYNSRVIAHNSDENKAIFGDKIEYFSGLSQKDMTEKLNTFISQEKSKVNYEEILNKYSTSNFIHNLMEII